MQLLSTLEWLFCSVGSCFVQLPDFRGAFHEGCFEMACAFSPPPGSIIAVTVENSVCFRRPPVSIGMVSTSFQIGCMLIHGISTHRPDSWLTDSELCWPSCCIRKTWFRLSFHCRTPFRSVFKLSPTVRLVQFMVFRDLSPRWFLVLRVCWRQQTIVSVIRNSLSGVFHDAASNFSSPLSRKQVVGVAVHTLGRHVSCSKTGWRYVLRGFTRRRFYDMERRYRSAMTGLLDVKDISAPEVKFLDRRRINGGEGALQVHVHRSRTRVWGAKMIRHRRSPAP